MNYIINQIGKELKKHTYDYLLLFTLGIFFIIFLKIFQGERFYTFATVLIFVFSYIIWGVFHHTKTRTLHIKNVVEYILIGFTILFLLQILLNY